MRTGKFLLLRVRTRSLYYFNLHVRGTPNRPHSRYFACLPNFCPKIVKKYSADFQQVTKKMHFFLHFFSKIFGHVKKKQYFCIRFWETNVFLFSTGGPDIKIQILSFEDLIFLRQTEG